MIGSAAIVGMGALGLLFGEPIVASLGPEHAAFVMDGARLARHQNDVYRINGKTVVFPMLASEKVRKPFDLVILAVKYPGMEQALATMAPCVGPNTILISLMNGISSEEILSKRFGAEKVLYSVAQEMDAQRYGTDLTFTKRGRLLLGVPKGGDPEVLSARERALREVCEFFTKAQVPYAVDQDIRTRQWSKWMLNVGCNQVCMVFDQGYGPCMEEGSLPFALMTGAMREVIALAGKRGIPVGEKELAEYLAIERTLAPDAVPSMGQDRRQGRRSEVELFAGEVLRQGKELGVETPVNAYLYRRVQEIEASYGG
ncbi:MAG: ketopantoate reductase family protein [Lachnospiraceae bacterium]